ncbi:MAG: hypothetical protein H6887_12060 [Hoeflea sp.]|nr:hypothetical protein [Hoeflea sp.]
MGVMRKFWASHEQEFSLHLLNLAIIFSAIVFAQTARTVSSRLKIFRRFHLSIIGNINGLIMNFLGSSYIYVTAFSGHELSVIISWLLIVVNILKVVRSRISDDFVITNIKTGASFSKVLSVLIFDVVARTYLSLVITFALACLLLEGPDRISSAETAVHFAISNKSDDIFVDLLYFSTISLTTVGYGDITPASVSAKLLASSFSLLGFIIFSVIIGLTLSVAMVFQKSDEPRNY